MKPRVPRAKFTILVRIERLDRDSVPDFFGSTHDLSQRGMLLSSPHRLVLGERIRIRLFLPRSQGEMLLEAMVIRPVVEDTASGYSPDEPSIASSFTYGVELVYVTDDDRARLAEFMENRSGDPRSPRSDEKPD